MSDAVDTSKALADLELAILSVLDAEKTSPTDLYVPLRAFTRRGFDREVTRAVLRRLRERQLVEYARGLWTDDGEMAGAGYAITAAGRATIEASPSDPAGHIAARPVAVAVDRPALIEAMARTIVFANGGERTASEAEWPRAVTHYRAMCARHAGYGKGRSLVNDAFRAAEAAVSALEVHLRMATRPGMTDLMLSPEQIDEFLARHPLPAPLPDEAR